MARSSFNMPALQVTEMPACTTSTLWTRWALGCSFSRGICFSTSFIGQVKNSKKGKRFLKLFDLCPRASYPFRLGRRSIVGGVHHPMLQSQKPSTLAFDGRERLGMCGLADESCAHPAAGTGINYTAVGGSFSGQEVAGTSSMMKAKSPLPSPKRSRCPSKITRFVSPSSCGFVGACFVMPSLRDGCFGNT